MKDMGNKNEKCYKILEEANKSLNSKYKFGPVRKQKGWRYYLEIADPRLPFIKRIFLGKDKDDRGINLSFYPADTVEQAVPLFKKVGADRTKFLAVVKQLSNSGYWIAANPHVGFAQTGYHPFKTYYSFKDGNEGFLKYLNYFILNTDKIRGGYGNMGEIDEIAKNINLDYIDNYETESTLSNIRTYNKMDKAHSPGLSFRPGFQIAYEYEEKFDIESYKSDIISRIDEMLGLLLSL